MTNHHLPELDLFEITHPSFPRVFYARRRSERDKHDQTPLARQAEIIFGIAFKKSLVEIDATGDASDAHGTLTIWRELIPGEIRITRRAATLEERHTYRTGSGFIEPRGVYG